MRPKDSNNVIETRKLKRQMHPNSLANLKPFVDNNPGGGRTPGSKNLSTLLREMLAAIAPNEIIKAKFVQEFCKGRTSITNADALTARIINEGLIKGEAWAIKEILDRTEGKALQALDVTSNGEDLFKQITIKILDGRNSDNNTQD